MTSAAALIAVSFAGPIALLRPVRLAAEGPA